MKFRPLIPMGAVTGRPSRQQLRDWLDGFAQVGIDQFMIYARTGLELDYLGPEWMEACRHIVEHAAARGMAVWLYDEFNWPSGEAGGAVLRSNPSFAARKLSVFAETGPGEPAAGPPARTRYRWVESLSPPRIDVLNPDAVDCFIRLTHERYAACLGSFFGTVIRGFFTDEPSPAYAASYNADPKAVLHLPCYAGMEVDYTRRTGRDFRGDVVESMEGRAPEGLWSVYHDLTGRRFRSAYLDRIADWCERRGLIFTGHLTNESSPRSAVECSGDPVGAIRAFTLPGIDEIFSNGTTDSVEWLTLKTVEQAAIHNRSGALAELFALGPCDMPLARMRQMIWLAALHGVDHFVTAVSSLDARANGVKDTYYNPISRTQPWFEALKELNDEAAMAAEWAAKPGVNPLAIRFPQRMASGRPPSAGAAPVDHRLLDLIKTLVGAQWNPVMIAEDDEAPSGAEAILSLSPDAIHEESRNLRFASAQSLLAWLESNVRRTAVVTTSEGALAEDLLVKCFDDGTAAVLSLSENDRDDLALGFNGRSVPIALPRYGLFAYRGQTPTEQDSGVAVGFPEGGTAYELDRPNVLRLVFDDQGVGSFTLCAALDGVRLVVRRDGETVDLVLDGHPLPIESSCQSLPDGFKELYRESGSLSLARGEHAVRLRRHIKDHPYLPSAFVSGPFVLDSNRRMDVLPALLDRGTCFQQALRQYVGKVVFKATVDCRGADVFVLNETEKVVEAFLGGERQGRVLWAPWRWKVPMCHRRDAVEVRLVVSTSIGPLFGECPSRFLAADGREKWVDWSVFWPSHRALGRKKED